MLKNVGSFLKCGKSAVLSFLFFALAAVNSFATATLDLSGVTTSVQEEVTGAAPVIAAILGIVIAIGIVITVLRRAK